MTEGSRRAILAAFLANLGIAGAKFVAFLATGAASMLAEAFHSLADTGNQGLLLFGAARARRLPSAEHPFGYGAERYFWAFVVAMVLFSMGSLFAVYEGIEKLRHPHAIASPGWAFGVLAVAIALETLSLHTAVRAAEPLRQGASWWAFVRSAKAPELPVVLLEDLAPCSGSCWRSAAWGWPGVARAIDVAEARLRSRLAEARVVYLEPDVLRPAPAE